MKTTTRTSLFFIPLAILSLGTAYAAFSLSTQNDAESITKNVVMKSGVVFSVFDPAAQK